MSNLSNFGKNNNPITGTFGTGKVKFITSNETFVVPAGITSVRARVWGAGGQGAAGFGKAGGGGGGFAMKTITGLTSGASISVTVGTSRGSSSSFGSYVSATGGSNTNSSTGGSGGTGSGGDINNTGGRGDDNSSNNAYGGGGGVASLFGNGGDSPNQSWERSANNNFIGGAVGAYRSFTNTASRPANGTRFYSDVYNSDDWDMENLDFIGTGASSYYTTTAGINGSPFNGAGGSAWARAAFPGGGVGSDATNNDRFGKGLVILEY